MLEYLYPGVYVEERDAGTTPIAGVATSIDPARGRALVDELARVVHAHAPAWTGDARADPGVTLAELLAFLAENVLAGDRAIDARERSAIARAASALAGAAGAAPCDRAPPVRPRYFAGRLLDAASFAAEQAYHREKRRLHNRTLHGCGVVAGLGVRTEGADGAVVVVEPGVALAPDGEELALPCGARLAAPAAGAHALVTLRFGERALNPVPVGGQGEPEATAVEEICIVGVGPGCADGAIAIARLVRAAEAWRVDATFAPPRARPPG
ncbi:MAG: hypothetical protein U1F58_09565 [Burkholderiales bacterium]